MKIFLSILLLSLLVIDSIFARFATKEDSDIEYELFNREVLVNADGTYEEVISQQIALLNERGRDNHGTVSFLYNHDSTKFKILEAYTILDGRKIIVSPKMIEDKPYGPQLIGFDSQHRVIVSYPKAELGAKLFIKYQEKVLKPYLKNFYDTSGYWGMRGYWSRGFVSIKSKMPLYFLVNDPYDNLEVKYIKENGGYIFQASLKKPLCLDLFNELNAVLSDDKKTWIKISTLDKHEDLIMQNSAKYEEIISSRLPEEYAKIAEEAKKISNEDHQINYVTSKLNEIIRYMGDWRTINGALFPRKLLEVAKTGFGDCKDFASSTAAILYNLGYKTNAVWVERSIGNSKVNQILPSFSLHNHAILKAVSPSGKEYFLDPTNFVSMANGIFPDIAGKRVYVLDSKNPRLEKIAEINHKTSGREEYSTYKYNRDGTINIAGSYSIFGESALGITGQHLRVSTKALEDWVTNFLSGDVACIEKKLSIPDLTSRIVENIKIEYEFKKIDDRRRTNLGKVVTFNMPQIIDNFIDVTDDRESDLYVDVPHTLYFQQIILDADKTNLSSLNLQYSTPFMNLERKSRIQNGKVILENKLELIRGYILNQELKTPEYKKLRDNLKREYRVGIITK